MLTGTEASDWLSVVPLGLQQRRSENESICNN